METDSSHGTIQRYRTGQQRVKFGFSRAFVDENLSEFWQTNRADMGRSSAAPVHALPVRQVEPYGKRGRQEPKRARKLFRRTCVLRLWAQT